MHKKFKIFFAITIPGFLILHILGVWRYYYTNNFYDNVLHFLAGFSAGLVVFWILQIKKIKNKKLICIIIVLIIGILWEILEYIGDTTIGISLNWKPMQLGPLDTFYDLVADILGGIFFISVYTYRQKQK